MRNPEVSGQFLRDAAGTVPFFRQGGIPEDKIYETLVNIRRVYEETQRPVKPEVWEAVIKRYGFQQFEPQDPHF